MECGHLKRAWHRGLYGQKCLKPTQTKKNKRPDLKEIQGQSDPIQVSAKIICPESNCGQPKQNVKVRERQQRLQNDGRAKK